MVARRPEDVLYALPSGGLALSTTGERVRGRLSGRDRGGRTVLGHCSRYIGAWGGAHVREPVTLPVADVAWRRARRPRAGLLVVIDDDVLPRLALWLADVTAETARGAQAVGADYPLPDTTPGRGRAPRVAR